ncbi:hypothetical protein PQR63_11615 [Herbaspirillum rhizosphaerae]|uniref:Lipoprotein n=1 Tax=Herbaspirillum rhizosphaerae TaxID=346179 RepID=A0ABW8Z970_9BURK
MLVRHAVLASVMFTALLAGCNKRDEAPAAPAASDSSAATPAPATPTPPAMTPPPAPAADAKPADAAPPATPPADNATNTDKKP